MLIRLPEGTLLNAEAVSALGSVRWIDGEVKRWGFAYYLARSFNFGVSGPDRVQVEAARKEFAAALEAFHYGPPFAYTCWALPEITGIENERLE